MDSFVKETKRNILPDSGTDRIIDNTQKTQMSENASSNSFWEKSSIMHLNSMYSVASKPVISSKHL